MPNISTEAQASRVLTVRMRRHYLLCMRISALWVVLLAASSCLPAISDKARQSARINYDIGVTSLNRGEHRDALRALMVAVDEDPDLPEAHNALGLVLHAMGKQQEALKHYQEAVALRDKFSEAYNNKGVLLLDMGRYDDAIADFKVALGNILYNTPYLAEGNMGWAFYKKGDVATAQEHIGNAVATDPQFCRGYQWLARIALEQDHADQVVAHAQRFKRYCVDNASVAASVAPDYKREMQYYLGMGYLKQGQLEPARQQFAECSVRDRDAVGFGSKCRQSLKALH